MSYEAQIAFSSKAMTKAGLILASLLGQQQSQIAQAAFHDVLCPAQTQMDGAQLSLAGLNVFEGPIEDRVALALEQPSGEPGVMRWSLDSGTTPYIKCRHQNSRHYLVLAAKGATHCVARMSGEQVFQASCSEP